MTLSHIAWPAGAPHNVLRAVFQSQAECIRITAPDGTLLDINPAGLAMVEASSIEEVRGRSVYQVVDEADAALYRRAHDVVIRTGEPQGPIEFNITGLKGGRRVIRSRFVPLRSEAGEIVAVLSTAHDITEQREAERALRESEALNRSMVEASADCIKLLDTEGRLKFMNRRGLCAMEIDCFEPLRDQLWWELWPEAQRSVVAAAVERARQNRIEEFTALCPTARGLEKWWNVVVSPVTDEAGRVTGLVAISRDVTEQRISEDRVRWLATHDVLTGLPNRLLLQERVEEAFKTADARGTKAAIILLDVDNFKEINDDRGHDAGDVLLTAVAERLQGHGSPVTTVARLGGDEFVLLIESISDDMPARAVAQSLIQQLHLPVAHSGRSIEAHGSFGIAIFPDHGRTYSDILKAADIALYAAKAMGRAGYAMFSPHMQRAMQHRIAVSERVRSGLDHQICPFYQPKFDLITGDFVGFEALMRIRQTNGRFQGPSSIASAFEDPELSYLLSERMLDCVISDMQRWLGQGVDFGHIAVNAAAPELRRDSFAERLLERLDRAGIVPSKFEVEVTESVFLGRQADAIERALRLLSSSGCGIALDDFGTGFASLTHVKQYPVSTLKIDRSFVAGLGSNSDDAAIVRAVIALGRSLGMTVVAEGIETAEQAAFLQMSGCRVGQGFLLGRPAAPRRVAAIVESAAKAAEVVAAERTRTSLKSVAH